MASAAETTVVVSETQSPSTTPISTTTTTTTPTPTPISTPISTTTTTTTKTITTTTITTLTNPISTTSTTTSTKNISSIKEILEEYLKSFNKKDETSEYVKFYAKDIKVHIPAFPPIQSVNELETLFIQGLSYFRERIRPTFFIVDDSQKTIAMEARMDCVALQSLDFKFPFTGKTYKKGENFTYEIVVHYEFNDDGLIQTWRAFSVVQYPDPGAGIKKEVLPGW